MWCREHCSGVGKIIEYSFRKMNMKKNLIIALSIFFVSCSGNSTGEIKNPDTTATATDTIMDMTNPGVGSIINDTAKHTGQ